MYDGNQLIAAGKSINGEPVEVAMPENAKLWSLILLFSIL